MAKYRKNINLSEQHKALHAGKACKDICIVNSFYLLPVIFNRTVKL